MYYTCYDIVSVWQIFIILKCFSCNIYFKLVTCYLMLWLLKYSQDKLFINNKFHNEFIQVLVCAAELADIKVENGNEKSLFWIRERGNIMHANAHHLAYEPIKTFERVATSWAEINHQYLWSRGLNCVSYKSSKSSFIVTNYIYIALHSLASC
jgi:hypothetical protein